MQVVEGGRGSAGNFSQQRDINASQCSVVERLIDDFRPCFIASILSTRIRSVQEEMTYHQLLASRDHGPGISTESRDLGVQIACARVIVMARIRMKIKGSVGRSGSSHNKGGTCICLSGGADRTMMVLSQGCSCSFLFPFAFSPLSSFFPLPFSPSLVVNGYRRLVVRA